MTDDKKGYDICKFNATKHGILSQQVVLDWENPAEYQELLEAFELEYSPSSITESYFVAELAQIVWRKRRLRILAATVDYIGTNNMTQADNSDKLIRYENHLDRKFEKTLGLFLTFKSLNKKPILVEAHTKHRANGLGFWNTHFKKNRK